MNTSFSKKRHIIEANRILEERYLKYVILEQNSTQTDTTTDEIVNKVSKALLGLNPNEMEIVNLLRNSGLDGQKFQDFVKKYQEKTKRDFGRSMYMVFQENRDAAEIEILRTWLQSIGLDMTKDSYKWIFSGDSGTAQVASGWEKYPCVSGSTGALFVKENDTYLVNKVYYYNNGTYQTQDQLKTGKYYCNRKGGISFNNWVTCADNFKKFCYNKTEIFRLQGCLGVKQDGYFGTNTETALHNKFPDFKGKVVTKTNINTICSGTSGTAGTAGTSGTSGALNSQVKQMTADDTTPDA